MSDGAGKALDAVALDKMISLALLDALEKLPPAERVTFLLRDVFGMEYAEIAETVGRTLAECQQLAQSARGDLMSSRDRTAAALRATTRPRPETP
jgi:RNA polymerase sigma-70 factor (ECF subfamily)